MNVWRGLRNFGPQPHIHPSIHRGRRVGQGILRGRSVDGDTGLGLAGGDGNLDRHGLCAGGKSHSGLVPPVGHQRTGLWGRHFLRDELRRTAALGLEGYAAFHRAKIRREHGGDVDLRAHRGVLLPPNNDGRRTGTA